MPEFSKPVLISTDAIAEKDRVEVAREIFGRQMLRLEIEHRDDHPFKANLKLRALNGVRIVTGDFAAAKISRTRALLSDGNDDLFLTLNQQGPFAVAQRGKDFVLGDNESVFSSCADEIRFERPLGKGIGVRIARSDFASQIPNIDDAINQLLPQHDRIMALLRSYLEVFEGERPLSQEFANLAATHVQDLIALSLGARRDYAQLARGRGLSAARLHAIKATVLKNLTRHDISVVAIAALHRVTPRHLQRLFENDGGTFSQFVLEARLALAHNSLTSPDHAHKSVGTIAYDSGFGDISYFNKTFRKAYGGSPTEIRFRSFMK